MTLATWDDALDVLDREVAAVEEALATGAAGLELADVALPTGLGRIPGHLVARATEIRDRQARALAALSLVTERARRAMVLGDSGALAGPSLFDQRG